MGKLFVALMILLAAAGLFGVSHSSAPAQALTNPACQYPNRSTNPPGGCDNSDPCDPADAAKGGSGECPPKSSETVTLPPTEHQDSNSEPERNSDFQGK